MATTTDRTSSTGREVRRVREALGWSRSTLARTADVSEATVARLELYGQTPSIPTLTAVAAALDVPVHTLLTPAEAAS
jgi:transcriptional regulator with XRE-family HTH domain